MTVTSTSDELPKLQDDPMWQIQDLVTNHITASGDELHALAVDLLAWKDKAVVEELQKIADGILDSNHPVDTASGGSIITIYNGKCVECAILDRIAQLKGQSDV